MKEKNENLKTIRIDKRYWLIVKELAENEGVSIKECVERSADYLLSNKLSFSEKINGDFIAKLNKIKEGSDTGVDRIIRILRAMERDYIIPISNDVIKITSQLNGMKRQVENLTEDETPEEQINSKPEKNLQISDESNQIIIAKYKRNTSKTLDLMEGLLNNAMRTRDNAPYVISLTADELKTYKEFCNDVRNDLSK